MITKRQYIDCPSASLVVDDSVQAKKHAHKIELVKRQYSDSECGVVQGIGVVNLLHSQADEYHAIDFRLYAKEMDGKSKSDCFQEMLLNVKSAKGMAAQTVIFDSWYGSRQNLKLIHRLKMTFLTTLKSNRLVGESIYPVITNA